jgi:beta-N-acetylhexosaminidase
MRAIIPIFRSLLYIFVLPLLAEMSLEEKVGQLMIVHFHGEEANAAAERLLKEAHVGGFILYNWSNGLTSPEQVKRLTASLQTMNPSALPLLIGIDQEGGRVSRLKEGFAQHPSQQESFTNKTVYQDTLLIAKELKSVGINLNFAPVIDVNSNPNNPVIGNRAYSSDPEMVAKAGNEALKAYQEMHILCTLKHFPGHGDTKSDSHHTLPRINKSIAELSACEWLPFQKLQKDAPLIMTAHLIISSVDPDQPATFSRKLLRGLLREQWGYQGVIISDSLVMKALRTYAPTPEEAALKALLGGCDLLCFGGKLLQEPSQDELSPDDIIRIHRFLVKAVKEGLYPETELNRSVERIAQIKSL